MSRGKWAVVIVALCLVVTVAAVAYAAGKAKAAAPKVVRAQQFELVDAEGRARIEIGMGGEHGQVPGVRVLDAEGAVRAALAVLPDSSPTLALYDAGGKARAALTTDSDGRPVLALASWGDRA